MMHKVRERAVRGAVSEQCSESNHDRACLARHGRPAEPKGVTGPTHEHVLYESDEFCIGLAAAHAPRHEAGRLIERRYSWRGYAIDAAKAVPGIAMYATLVAASGAHVFGTLTIGIDSLAGLQVDQLYPQEMSEIRTQHGFVCEFTRLAVDPEYGTKEALAALFHVAFLYAAGIHGCHEIVIEVNPRHVAFYKRMLGFIEAGPERICARVAAPAVLLRLPCAYAADQITQHAGEPAQGGRSLYSHFLHSHEAEAVLGRARAAAALMSGQGARRNWSEVDAARRAA